MSNYYRYLIVSLQALFVTVFVFACAKNNATKVAPVSKLEAQGLRNAALFGGGISPDEAIPQAADCASFIRGLKGFKTGTIEVPEDWDHPKSSPKINVFYYWRKADGEGAKRPPVVFYNGGPASDSHGSAELLAPLEFTNNADLVFIDQRGTGCSTAFPSKNNEATALRLMNWGSRGIVGDSEAIRLQLFGNQRWRAYGQSYGGFIVHRYLEIAPEGLDRAIAHGASIMHDPILWDVERLRSQKRVGENYFAKFPEDRLLLAMARTAIPNDHCWAQGDFSVCGPVVLDSLTILLGFQSSWLSLHRWIQKLRDAKGVLDYAILDSLVRELVFGVFAEGGLGGNVLSKMEIVPGYDDSASCAESFKVLRAAGEDPDAFDINECRLLSGLKSPYFPLMKNVTGRPIAINKIASVLKSGGPGFFLFSGAQDVFVPVNTFSEEVQQLDKLVHYKSFPGSGHEGFYTESEVQEAVTSPGSQK